MLILASSSPRRREILENAGYKFEILPANIDESVPNDISPEDAVKMIAAKKASAVKENCSNDDIILGADTVVCLDGEIIGKPVSLEDAKNTLKRLSGNTHSVLTGYCLIKGEKIISGVEKTEVTFRELTDFEIDEYVASGEPMDKAGSYGLQGKGGLFARGINGDYNNIIGLPISTVSSIIEKMQLRQNN